MYKWNDIRIRVRGNNPDFMGCISKYINTEKTDTGNNSHDIDVNVSSDFNIIPIIEDARHLKSLDFNSPEGLHLDIYSKGQQIWYIYREVASVWIDYKSNKMMIAVSGLPLEFEYYNILIFFLQPIGSLFENFGYFRVHSSCGAIDGRAILVTGVSGSGKSTSAFSIPLYGGVIISDDLTYIKLKDGVYRTYSLTSLVKLREDAIEKFYPEMLTMKTSVRFEDERYFELSTVNHERVDTAILCGIAMLNKTGNISSSYESVQPTKIIPHLFPSTINTNIPENTTRKFMFITEIMDSLDCFRINFGTDMKLYYNEVRKILGVNGNE